MDFWERAAEKANDPNRFVARYKSGDLVETHLGLGYVRYVCQASCKYYVQINIGIIHVDFYDVKGCHDIAAVA